MLNIYYELGLFNSHGKETIVIKTDDFDIPSDSIRTEYIPFNDNFNKKLKEFISSVLDRGIHYSDMADLISEDPILSFDYMRRAYLISGVKSLKDEASGVFIHNEEYFKGNDKLFARAFLK